MGLQVSTDRDTVRAWCDAAVTADAVANTVFGAIAASVLRDDAAPWAMREAGEPGLCAARSQATTPVTATMPWSDATALADALAGLDPPPAAFAGHPDLVAAVAARLDRAIASSMSERLFRCDELHAPAAVPGSARLATAADAGWLTGWWAAFLVEAFGALPPDFHGRRDVERGLTVSRCWVWTDAAGVAVSYAVRHKAASGVSRIGPVYTPPAHRGRGYGSAVTAAATGDALCDGGSDGSSDGGSGGGVACLFTDLANPTSNKIYRAIGYRPVLDRTLVRFA